MYSLDQLRAFVAAAEQGSFSGAARRLGKAQSAVSQAIANLEIDWGVELFDRRTRKPMLTDKGVTLLAHARVVLNQARGLEIAAAALEQEQETTLNLAVDEALMVSAIEPVLREFAERFPATSLALHAVASPDVLALVAGGRAQMGLMFSNLSFHDEVDSCYLGELPFVVVASSTHPLAKLEAVRLADLCVYRQLMVRGFDGLGLEQVPPVSAQQWWANNLFLLRELARQGLGWSYVPQHMITQELAAGSLVVLPVVFDHKPWRAPVDRVVARGAKPGPALSWLMAAVTDCFSEG
ncbi:transcriptional regulator, LysR family [Ferrimonas balearica DSM 9799]|uniref:Transcriptional regulator, LysR family n=1 Tax=Ferrimonas balearica (strain DSM 9799 / CCM 4581 / KCTC 23876 / PAT) TaxID=550540 RepID=E1SV64_FERBD|nr:LysR family transcriptional regulator [Ferrimonas balearica]ADN77364.1 transcriptional regulator, LysR family [Ferrimonas balearica DSM 9799]